jgi:hypothetical protein
MGELNARLLKESDYEEILVEWWNDWGWSPPARDFLPENGTGGIIVYDDEIPVCAGFTYLTNSNASWVDWIISNKQYRKKPQRKEALMFLINSLTISCEIAGSKYIYALIKHEGLCDIYEQFGYIKGDSYTKEMIKII